MKVLLVDDHPLILQALQAVIEKKGEDVQVLGVDSARAAREVLASGRRFDLVLLDLALGDASGFDLLGEFRQDYPEVPVVVISASERASDVIRAIDQGAMGFVPKRSSNETLCDALRMVMSGGIYVPPMQIGATGDVGDFGAPAAPSHAPSHMASGPFAPSPSPASDIHRYAKAEEFQRPPIWQSLGLTPRQADVLALLLQGQPNKMIARELGLSVETVKDHVAAVLRALGVNSRTQAVLAVSQMAQQQGNFMVWRPSR